MNTTDSTAPATSEPVTDEPAKAPAKKAPAKSTAKAKAPAKSTPKKAPAKKSPAKAEKAPAPGEMTAERKRALNDAIVRASWEIPVARIRELSGLPADIKDAVIVAALDRHMKYLSPRAYNDGKRVPAPKK